MRLYATDDVMSDHARRSSGEDCPLLHKFMAMDMDDRWVNRSPETMLETFHWFQGEGFNLIIEDLLRLTRDRGIIVEGFRLLPHLVKPLISASTHAVWLLPTPSFRQAVIESRGGSSWEFLARTSNPQPTRTRPNVHRHPPRGNSALGITLDRGRHHNHRRRCRQASNGRIRTLTKEREIDISCV